MGWLSFSAAKEQNSTHQASKNDKKGGKGSSKGGKGGKGKSKGKGKGKGGAKKDVIPKPDKSAPQEEWDAWKVAMGYMSSQKDGSSAKPEGPPKPGNGAPQEEWDAWKVAMGYEVKTMPKKDGPPRPASDAPQEEWDAWKEARGYTQKDGAAPAPAPAPAKSEQITKEAVVTVEEPTPAESDAPAPSGKRKWNDKKVDKPPAKKKKPVSDGNVKNLGAGEEEGSTLDQMKGDTWSKKEAADNKAREGLKRKREAAAAAKAGAEGASAEGEKEDKEEVKKYICFVGNLPYSATKEGLEKVFKVGAGFDSLIQIRLPTDKSSGKIKGFAFVEYSDYEAMKMALKLHQTKIDGRKINVEFTAGGGGTGEARKQKIADKSQKLKDNRHKKWKEGDRPVAKKNKVSEGSVKNLGN